MLHRSKIRILLVQITNKNYGDSVIADNTRFLLNKAIPRYALSQYVILDYAINTEDLEQVKYVDAIVFAGGGLVKFRQENLYRQVSELIMEAQRYDVPVFLNAVGVEGYDAEDERCKMLVEALNQPCVKAISVRDDVNCLKQNYVRNSKVRIREVYDPAVWSEKTYRIHSEPTGHPKYIGLGIARDTLFVDYGIDSIDRTYLLDLWKNIIILLEDRGYRWKIFTNGLDLDEMFAQSVLEEIGHGEKIVQPVNARALVGEIAAMDGMIACRMHSNIIAYSLGIPSIGLVWNDKMTHWGEKCGYRERYIPYTELQAENIVNQLERALHDNTCRPSWWKKHKTYKEIRHFVRWNCKPRNQQVPKLNVSKHMVAAALGGCDFKYKNMNTIPMMWESLKNGYRFLELDVRLSADEKLVCVNGWTEGTKKALGCVQQEGALSEKQFLDSAYYHHFPTCTFEQLIEEFSALPQEYKNAKLILDVGKPQTALLDSFYEQLVAVLRKFDIAESRIMIRMQRERDVAAFKNQKYPCKMVYFISAETVQAGEESAAYQKVMEFCKKKKIKTISMTDKTWTKELQEKLKSQGFQTMILSYTRAGDVIEAVQAGADLVASHYYGVDYLEKML